MQDLYSVLGVSRGASAGEIKKAYRKLAGEFHPDRNPGAANEQRFKDVANAYEVLGDDDKRKLYDEFGEISTRPGFDAERARAAKNFGGFGGGGQVPFDLSDLFGGGRAGGGAPGNLGDLFGDLFGGGGGGGVRSGAGARARAFRGQDTLSTVRISFSDAVLGTTLRLTPRSGGDPIQVRIPPGADDGSRVRVRGKGGSGVNGGPAGDLLLEIEVERHEHFTREGDDLYLDLPVTLVEAYRGAKIDVPTPQGEVKLTVPAGTQSGQKMRLRGKGVQRRGKPAGDLYVRFLVTYPTVEEVAEAVEAIADHVGSPREGIAF
ncbi:MAG: DnaJ C-terminal domain-containing protein [Myxococcota bacterium]